MNDASRFPIAAKAGLGNRRPEKDLVTAKLAAAGFEVVGAYGLAYCGESAAKGVFSAEEMARHRGVYAEPADGYALAYVCRKPGGTA